MNYRATAATEQRKGTQWSGYRELYSKTLLKPEKKWPCSGQSSSSPRYSPEGKREWGLWARSSWASGKLEEAPSSICLRPSTEQKVIKQLRLQRKPWITEAPSLSLSLSRTCCICMYIIIDHFAKRMSLFWCFCKLTNCCFAVFVDGWMVEVERGIYRRRNGGESETKIRILTGIERQTESELYLDLNNDI